MLDCPRQKVYSRWQAIAIASSGKTNFLMEEKNATRKLTTIFYADVAGYSRLTGSDELGTHQAVMDLLDYAQNTIQQEGGKVLRFAGDAILAEFSSVVSCVNAAITVQTQQALINKDIPSGATGIGSYWNQSGRGNRGSRGNIW